MTTQTEALKLAFEALEDRVSLMKWQIARDAVKKALAQPKQEQGEPVAFIEKSQFDLMLTKANLELVQKVDKLLNAQQRTWVGLTHDEINEIWESQTKTGEQITRAIEAKLKEKNT